MHNNQLCSTAKQGLHLTTVTMTARTDLSGEDTILERSGDRNIKLYGSWFCPYVQRVWIALEEKG